MGNNEERGCIDMQYAGTSPTYLLDGLIAKCELRELLNLLYDELEAAPIGLLVKARSLLLTIVHLHRASLSKKPL